MDNEWRLITEDQPAKNVPVLLGAPGCFWGPGVVGHRVEDPKNIEWQPLLWQDKIVDGLDYYAVHTWYHLYWLATHWMPLPTPPKKEQREL